MNQIQLEPITMTPYIQGEMSKSNTHADLHDGTNYVQDLEQPPQSNLTEKFPSKGKQLVNMAVCVCVCKYYRCHNN